MGRTGVACCTGKHRANQTALHVLVARPQQRGYDGVCFDFRP